MKAYAVYYKMHSESEPKLIDLLARSRLDAYDKAVFEVIPAREGGLPYSAWVASVTHNNGNCKQFNTFEGKPY